MKIKIIASALSFVAIAVVTWKIIPPHISDKVTGTALLFSNERLCFNHHKESLKDPYTAYVLSSYTLTKKLAQEYDPNTEERFKDYDAFIVVRAQAKNSFGAYGKVTFECPLIDGQYNETYTLLHAVEQRQKAAQKYQ